MNPTLPIGAAALLLVAGCIQDGTRPGAPLEVTRISPEAPSPVYYSGMVEPLRTAVFDQAKFAEYWAQAFANRDPAPALPKVDFEREFVVVAALGERSSGGYAIEVARADGEGGAAVVEIETTAPGKNCAVTLALTQPVDFVKVSRAGPGSTQVRFVEKPLVRDCGN